MKKKFLVTFFLATTIQLASAADIALQNLSKDEVNDLSNEFSANFSHTVVAAPETEGAFGVEVGLAAGLTTSDTFKKLINEAGENGDDYGKLPHAGLIARVHFAFDIFAELNYLPSYDSDELSLESRSFAVGWNLGNFFSFPLDVAVGVNMSQSELSYQQVISSVNTDVTFENSTRTLWVGVSKNVLFLTPYAKLGTISNETDLKVDGSTTILDFTSSTSYNATDSGMYLAAGLNVQLLAFRLGAEYSKINDINRMSAKLSIAF